MSPIRVLLVTADSTIEHSVITAVEQTSDMIIAAQAATGPGALQVCEATHPDMVILDADQTGLKLAEITRAIRQNHPQTKILVCAHTPAQLDTVLKAGAHSYLLNNTLPEDLVAALHSTHAGKTVISLDIIHHLLGFPDNSSQNFHS
ncbi:MAG: response regulator transcription factor [Anaerolineae bacterium]|nr:response regulator transcription factor [Anaerolineae bacterium]